MISQNYETNAASPINIRIIMLVTRLFIVLVGLGLTLFGAKYTVEIFLLLHSNLQTPETLSPLIEQWSVLLTLKGFTVAGYPVDKILTVVILAVGVLLLLRITLGFLQAGITMLIHSANASGNLAQPSSQQRIENLDYKLNKLRSMADQGVISKKAYEDARDRYWIEKIMHD